jgi:deaminated glutathione amidase
MLRAGIVQLNVGDEPAENLAESQRLIDRAAAQGARFVLTPEVTNIISASRSHQNNVLRPESSDATLRALCAQARRRKIWLLIGSLALKTSDPQGRFANRSFLISPDGRVMARYDKIHMFDVTVSAAEIYRESAGYRAGDTAVAVQTDIGRIGMSICYDLRFARLFRLLAQAGAQIITVPSAFSPATGAAHWEVLLRARAIETGSFILAPAQTGTHESRHAKPRSTYGHSLAIDPWGRVLADAGTQTGVTLVDLDLSQVAEARERIPALTNHRPYEKPNHE